MTLEELEKEADAIAARRADHRTPAVVRRAFLPPFCAITLRKWLQLEAVNSPLIAGEWPWEDPQAMAEAFTVSYATIFPGRSIPAPEMLQEALIEMNSEIERAIEAIMPMKSPRVEGVHQHASHDGLGWVARLLAASVKNNIDGPLDLPLDQLHILTAGMAANEGMECAGADYRDREVLSGLGAQMESVDDGRNVNDQSANNCGAQQDDSHGKKQSSSNPVIDHLEQSRKDKIQPGRAEGSGATPHV